MLTPVLTMVYTATNCVIVWLGQAEKNNGVSHCVHTLCCFVASRAELSIHFTVSRRLHCKEACSKAFTTLRYVSCNSVYLPTSPITASSETGVVGR